MKQLWISIGIMIFMFAAALTNSWYLSQLTEQFTNTLTQAQEAAEKGDWTSAAALTDRVQEQWKQSESYLYVILRHDETDAVGAGLREVRQLLAWKEIPEYTAANARLVEDIRLLAEMEQFNLKNLL